MFIFCLLEIQLNVLFLCLTYIRKYNAVQLREMKVYKNMLNGIYVKLK